MNNIPQPLAKLYVQKSTGETEIFSQEKLKQSLTRSGAESSVIEAIVSEILVWMEEETKRLSGNSESVRWGQDGLDSVFAIPSRKIYTMAFSLLRKRTKGNAARYKLKSAMMEMGPTGHPFEHFSGEIYRALGYDVEVAKTLDGHCVTHEVDVIATKDRHQRFIECKYYQSTGKNANVQVPLYIRSRVDDIIKIRSTRAEYDGFTFSGGVVTNTRFTEDAEKYGECCGLHLLSWDYPKGNGIREIIDRYRLYPITSLTSLSKTDKQILMDNGVVTCRQISIAPALLDYLKAPNSKIDKIKAEVKELTL
ncbi:MAG: hypothetical protein A2X17_07660 [Bacteroidetes bacterium GWF2_41_61]|nr:MAG: hypothetical protein A2X20_12100 [Bacteroidetes bacterium GWE2_40_15]OFY30072.1 MAG: hypothetical protein A2X17_07660 [Bacteroidetes bacterium GWF2_41_61]HBG23625.1 ATP-binding protein [Rikenellaceae bacterium]HBZ25011.1 ATP-binding protein [Rikenellaceae bacterium]